MELSDMVQDVINRMGVVMQHPSGRVLLLRHPLFQEVIQQCVNQVIPTLTVSICGRDRQQVEQATREVLANRKLRQEVGVESINLKAYEAFLVDLRSVHEQLEAPHANLLPVEERAARTGPLPHQVSRSETNAAISPNVS